MVWLNDAAAQLHAVEQCVVWAHLLVLFAIQHMHLKFGETSFSPSPDVSIHRVHITIIAPQTQQL